MKNREQEIARENISDLMNGKFSLDPKKISNKTLLFDTTKIDKEILVDMIIRALLADNDDFYIEHLHESISFTLKRQGEIWQKAPAKSKQHIQKFKNSSKQHPIFRRKNRLIKKLKKSKYAKDSLLLKLTGLLEQSIDEIPTTVDFLEKGETDRSTLYSFDGPFQLIHADVGNLQF